MTKSLDKAPASPALDGDSLVIASPETLSEACFSIPAVRALQAAYPKMTLSVVANTTTASLWRALGTIEEVITYSPGDSSRRIARALSASGLSFDCAIAWEDSPAARSLAKARIAQRLGYPNGKLGKLLSHPVEIKRMAAPIEHRVRDYLLFSRELGASPFEPANFVHPERPPAANPTRVVLAPGSDFGAAAEWPLERFLEVARALSEGHELAVLPSPDRPEPAHSLAKLLDLPVTEFEGDDLLALLASSRALVANDGSLPHLASFVGTPSVVIFGPNHPDWQRPLGTIHRIVHEHVACSGCLLHKCPLDHRCMNDLPVRRILAAFHDLPLPAAEEKPSS